MPIADDKGIGIKGWITGSKPKTRAEGSGSEQVVLDKHRIAILPFSNISPETKDEYFADGMTEELISTMSKISGLVVIARTSVMGYKGSQKKISEVAKELQVGTVLEGSVRKSGEKLRITVQLIDPLTSGHLWAESYDRDLKDVFAIQSDISKTIAQTLKVQFLPKEKATIESKQTTDPEAHILYLKGRFYWNQRSKPALAKAIEYFENAIQLDPEYALAYSGLADSYYIIAQYGFGNPATNFQLARSFAEKALELDADLPEAHVTLAAIAQDHDFDWARSEKEFKRAIALNPNYATAHQWYYLQLICQEKVGEAYEELKKALELDPLSLIINNNLAEYFFIRKEYDLAERQIKNILEMSPDFLESHWILMWTYLSTSKPEQARQEATIISGLSKAPSAGKMAFAYFYAMTGGVGETRNLLSELEKMKASGEYVSSTALAEVSFLIGDVDEGFEWLERSYEEREGHLTYIKINDSFDAIRSDPRYLSLLKKIGLQ